MVGSQHLYGSTMGAPKLPEQKCLAEKCERGSRDGGRGNCRMHFNALMRLVKRKQTTWDELESLKMSLPARRLRGAGTSMLEILERRRANAEERIKKEHSE